MNGPQFLFFPFNKNFLWPSFVMVENNAENDLTCWCIVVVSLVMGPKEGLVTTEWHFKWARSRHPIPISIIMISLCHYHHYHRNRLLTLFSDFSNWNFHFPYLKIAWKWHSKSRRQAWYDIRHCSIKIIFNVYFVTKMLVRESWSFDMSLTVVISLYFEL